MTTAEADRFADLEGRIAALESRLEDRTAPPARLSDAELRAKIKALYGHLPPFVAQKAEQFLRGGRHEPR